MKNTYYIKFEVVTKEKHNEYRIQYIQYYDAKGYVSEHKNYYSEKTFEITSFDDVVKVVEEHFTSYVTIKWNKYSELDFSIVVKV